MNWILTDKEIEAVLAADGKHRYDYFIHRVCETRKVWALYQDGWASFGDGETQLIPFWPHEAFASRFKMGAWERFSPTQIELAEFLERWIPGMKREGVGAAIFPVESGTALFVGLEDLEASLRQELEQYGDDGQPESLA